MELCKGLRTSNIEHPTSNEKIEKLATNPHGRKETDVRRHPGEMRSAVVNEFHWVKKSEVRRARARDRDPQTCPPLEDYAD